MTALRDFVAELMEREGAAVETLEPDGLAVIAPPEVRSGFGWQELVVRYVEMRRRSGRAIARIGSATWPEAAPLTKRKSDAAMTAIRASRSRSIREWGMAAAALGPP